MNFEVLYMAGLTLGEVLFKAILISPVIESGTSIIAKLEFKMGALGPNYLGLIL